jgi:3-deoxy-D-manno-octulosonic-acid transferase
VRLVLSLLSNRKNKESYWHIRERSGFPAASENCKDKEVIWIHAASLGEAKILIKFASILQKKYSDTLLILTAVTESGVTYLRRHKTESVCAVGFLPIDTIFLMNKMINTFTISRVWLIETEIWPAMLWTCLIKNIPVGIVNARMEVKSFKIYKSFLWMLKPFFTHIDIILAQDKKYAARFEALGTSRDSIHIIGNIKSYITIKAPAPEKKLFIRHKMNLGDEDTVITAGCIHPDETDVIKKTIEILKSKGYTWKWIVVPRHLNKSLIIKRGLGENTIMTQDMDLSVEWDVCVIDSFGILEDLYKIADSAVLCGTFNNIGGHNVWEAVQFAIPVFFGPDYHTQQESSEQILEAGVAFCVNNSDELAHGLIKAINNNKNVFSTGVTKLKKSMQKEISSLESYI